jgi:PAS domain S-box-containing protein
VRALLAAVASSTRARIAAAALLLACGAALPVFAAEQPARNVLLLQSYQKGPAWVQHLTEGLVSVFSKSRDFTFNYRFEYMSIYDADPSGWAAAYRRRLGALRFDIVICADPQSLEFLVDNRSTLFSGIPIVFCNIDDFSFELLKGESGITGVTNELDFEGTIELARRLHPDMKRLLVLANRRLAAESPTYAKLVDVARYRKLAGRIEVEYWEDPKLSEISERAGAFPPGTVVLDMAFLADDAGKPLGLLAGTRKASEELGLPMYSCWESLLGDGIVGGMISGSFQQGEAAGKLALRILRGADPDTLPVVRGGTSRAMIDYAQLERFGIPERRLPRGTMVINQPPSLYERYRGLVWAIAAVVAALLAMLVLSWIYIVSQQRLRKILHQSQERLSLALASTASGIWEYYPKTQRSWYDPQWFTMLGYEPYALPPEYTTWADLLHPDDRAPTELAIQRNVDEGTDFTIEFRLRGRDGRWVWISSSGKIVERDSKGSALRIVGTHVDISERKRAQAELEQAYQNLERRVAERTRELAVLNDLAAVVSRSLDLLEISESALEKTMDAAGMESGAAYRLDEPAQTLVLVAHRGLSSRFVTLISQIPLETALGGKPFDAEHPVVWSPADYPEGDLKRGIQREGLAMVIGVPVTSKGRTLGALVLGTRTARTLSGEECVLLMAIGRQISLAIENASLFQMESAKHEEAERRRTVAEGLREILAALNSNRPLQRTLDLIIGQTCRVTGSDAASLLQRETPDGPFVIRSACGLDPDYVAAIRFSAGKGGAGRALAARGPVVVSDARSFVDRFTKEPDPELAEEARALELMIGNGFSALLSVPLVIKDEDYGGITLYYRSPREFSQEDIEVAVSVADQAALAIENARLRDQAEQAAAFAERSRLARELHDSVTQSLYSITLYAEAVARMLTSGRSPEAAEHLRELRSTAQDALREMRLLIFQLSPPALEKGGLAGALQMRLDAVESRGGLNVDLRVEGAENLKPRVQQELYQIAQEALNNTLKHARAQSVRILLDFRGTEIRLEIADDGCGFDPQAADRSGGLGLRGMRERAAQIAGSLSVESSPGKGTTLRVAVPAAEPER